MDKLTENTGEAKKELRGKGVNGNLIPPVKGERRNPAGKPKGQRNYATIYREALVKIASSQGMSADQIEDVLLQSGLKNALKGDYRFYQDVMDRIHGKPSQSLELAGKDGGPIDSQVEIIIKHV